MNISIGFDPGIDTGGIAVLPVDDKSKLKTYMTPRLPSRKVVGKTVKGDIDICKMFSIVLEAAKEIHDNGGGNLLIIYEDVHNIKNSSSKSNFSFGNRKGEICGMAYAASESIPMIYNDVHVIVDKVYSTVWQKHSVDFRDKKMGGWKSDTKYSSIKTALRLFPGHSFTKERGKVPQDGMTDAALIALYGADAILSSL